MPESKIELATFLSFTIRGAVNTIILAALEVLRRTRELDEGYPCDWRARIEELGSHELCPTLPLKSAFYEENGMLMMPDKAP